MSKPVDQNPFPKVWLVEGSAPTAPASGRQAFYVDSADRLLKSIDSSSGARFAGLMQRATVTLTDAQIKALPTTPFTAVAAPNAGTRIKVFAVSLSKTTTAGAYTNVNATYAVLWLGTSGQPVTSYMLNDSSLSTNATAVTNFFGTADTTIVDMVVPALQEIDDGTAGKWWIVPNDGNLAGTGATSWDALAVTLQMDNNGSGNLTGGNAANTLRVSVYYSVESL